MKVLKLAFKDNLAPYLRGIADYVESCDASCDCDLPAFPEKLSDMRTSDRGTDGCTATVIIFPSDELTAWFAAFVTATKANPVYPKRRA